MMGKCAFGLLAFTTAATAYDYWDVVDGIIANFSFIPSMAFSAGDSTGRKHTFEKGAHVNMRTQMIMASSSKFPAAVAIAGAVNDGHLSFDTKASEVFPWWTKNPFDVRSRVTLAHLLTFTSGMISMDFADCGTKCLSLPNASQYNPEECAREIYEEFKHNGHDNHWVEPGTLWSYHSNHLQVAGPMAAKAAGLTVEALIEKYLTKPLGMTSTFWGGYPNPHLAASMITTGDDYDKLLQSILTYKILPKRIIDQMEEDAYRRYPRLKFAPFPKDTSLAFYGHYSMGTYFECISQKWNLLCELAGVHADPGAFGYWPLIDRSKGYYMQLVVFRPVNFPKEIMDKYKLTQDSLAALPGHCTSPLRFETGYFVEKALGKGLFAADNSSSPRSLSSAQADPDPLAFFCELAKQYPPQQSQISNELLV
jgi:CubicO group peptidase (beta-lactamase class C family)